MSSSRQRRKKRNPPKPPVEITNVWNDVREANRDEKAYRFTTWEADHHKLTEGGHHVHQFSVHHFRINGVLDVWPSTGRFNLFASPLRFDPNHGWVYKGPIKGRVTVDSSIVEHILQHFDRTARERGVVKDKKKPTVFRLWNLKTAEWASELRHDRNDDVLRERIGRINAADPKVQELAREALLMVREDDIAYRERRQAAFDQRHPKIAARRVAQHEQHDHEKTGGGGSPQADAMAEALP